LKIPYVITVHGLDAFFDKQVRGYAGRWCERVTQFVYRSAARVICISDKVAENVAERDKAPVNPTVIYNGVDARMFAPPSAASPSRSILSVGNLIPIKGHELLLRALAAVLPQYPDVSVDMIGDGPEYQRLTRLASECNLTDRVRFLGRQSREQVAEAMRRCMMFALPSRYEGLGCVYLEAMSTEKPVIACRGQGIDGIIHHGRNGWLVDPGSVQELITAFSTLLQNLQLRRQIGESARRTILNGLTTTHQADRLAALYRECVA
jgi:glycosyltransferase involved in cell wall biosynthesis